MSLRQDIPDQYLEVDGLKVRFIEKGSGRPLLCLHGMGFSLSADQWLPHIDAFSEFSHVYALDFPGWGESSHASAGDYFPLWVRIVKGFCDQLNLQDMDVFGYSIGGWVSCLFAGQNPGRVRRLVLLDSPGLNLQAPSFIADFKMPDQDSVKRDLTQHMKEMAVTDSMVGEVYGRLTRSGHEEAYRAVAAYVANADVRKQFSLHSVFPNLAMPILFSQMDNAGAVMIKYIFEAFQLAPNGRVFIYYGGTQRTVGGIVKEMEKTAIDFLTAEEVPIARK